MITYYVEATVPGRGLMQDMGLTASQVEQLRDAERAGKISGLIVREDITDLAGAFRF